MTLKKWTNLLPEFLIPAAAIILALALGLLLVLAIGKSPAEAFGALVRANFGSKNGVAEMLVSTTPLIFTGLAVALAFRCGLFNIGGEGQYLVAGIAAAFVGYRFPGLGPVHWLAALLAGALLGGIWAAIAGLLKAYRGVHEVVNTIMLNYIALFLSSYVVINFIKKPGPLPVSPDVAPHAKLGILLSGTRLHAGIIVALVVAGLVWLLLYRTTAGYSIRAVGFAPKAAEYGGINVALNTVLAMGLSGALAGLAGAVQVLGVQGAFYDPIGGFVGYGFDGIAVALLGRNHPVGVVLAALLFGILDRGSGAMQAVAGVPKAVVWILQAAVVFFVAADGIIRRIVLHREAAA